MDLFIDLYSECDIDSVRNNNCVNVFINSGFVRIIIFVFRYNNCVTIFVGCYPNCVYNAICINNNSYGDLFIRLFFASGDYDVNWTTPQCILTLRLISKL